MTIEGKVVAVTLVTSGIGRTIAAARHRQCACLLSSDDAQAITGAEIAIDQAQTAGSLYSEAVYHALSGGWSPT